LLAYAGLLAAINGFSDRLLGSFAGGGFYQALLGLGGISAIGWFAFYAIVVISTEAGRAEQTTRSDQLIAGATIILCFVPWNLVAALLLLPLGTYAAATAEPGSRTRRIGVIFLALTGPLLWGRILLAWFAPLLLGLDARLSAILAGTSVWGNVVQFVGVDRKFYVGPACSSLHNISLAILLWATLLQLLRLRFTVPLLIVALAGALAMALVNILRLAAIAKYPASFVYLHAGAGMELFAWGSLILAAAVIGGGILVASRAAD
jgi:hypothetical protein